MLVLSKPTYPEFQELFSNDSAVKILAVLFRMSNKRSSAAKLASILGIHISTAKKHLEALHKQGFLNKHTTKNQPGKPTYYTLKTDQNLILLDLNIIAKTVDFNIIIPNVFIREKKGLYPRIQFIFEKDRSIKTIKIRIRTKAHRTITRDLNLTEDEGKFLKYLPHPTMEPCSLVESCKNANITGSIRIKSIYNFVEKLTDIGIIEIIEEA